MITPLLALALVFATPVVHAADNAAETEAVDPDRLEVWKAPAGVVQDTRKAVNQILTLPEETLAVRWFTRALPRYGGAMPSAHPNQLAAWVRFEERSLPPEWGKPTLPPDGVVVLERETAERLFPPKVLALAKDQGSRLRFDVAGVYTRAPVLEEGVVLETAWHFEGKGLYVSLVGLPPPPSDTP